MKKVFCRSLVLALGVALVASAASAKNVGKGYANYDRESISVVNSDNPAVLNGLAASAAQGTTWLATYTFDVGASCNTNSWTTADITAQTGGYWHVDDFSGLAGYAPIQGTKSLWCGARPSTSTILCGYSNLPGYGNGWNQAWCTKTCVSVADGNLSVAFKAIFDSEPGYDATTLEYDDCGAAGESWVEVDGGVGIWDGFVALDVAADYPVSNGTYKVRLHFVSDGAWSDQDGNWPTNGAVLIDSLKAEGLAVEDFEGEALNATASNDWQICTPAGYGQYMNLFPGVAQVQEDPCARDLSCVWAAINGSTYNYSCGGFPAQKAVPFGNADGQYIDNEVWSPNIAIAGSGSRVVLRFTVYRDMPLDNLIFYVWHVRTIVAGCPGAWRDRNFVYYGGQKDWLQNDQSVGDLLNLNTGTAVNVALGVVDQCAVWCGVYGSGACHSGAPYLDQVKLFRVATAGAQWSVRDIDTFQDSFANDGSLTGTVRADMANDVLPSANPGIIPGDSSVVNVSDPVSGLADDGGKKAIYCFVAVQPFGQVGKSGSALSGDLVRFPHKGSQVVNGITWDIIQFDQAILNGNPVANVYCVDLNDALFTPGDTVLFFYKAVSADVSATTNYFSLNWGTDTNINSVAANAMEFTCFPAGGYNRGGDILYVDGMDGRGAEPFFTTAFQSLGILDKVDRYDVRGPSSGVNNRLDGRVYNISQQLVGVYRKILWDNGDLSITLGDGSGTPEKTDDYGLVNSFLGGLTNPGGVYICGDDVGDELNKYSSLSATTFRSTYLSYTQVLANHKPTYGVSPAGIRNPAGFFGDNIVIFGGCPLINDFDVMQATGSAVGQMGYGSFGANNHAVISQATNNGSTTVGVVFSGFAFEYIRDDENDGVSDRAKHMYDIITWLGNIVNQPTGAGPALDNELSQNYPNPFNPQTTIAFSIKDRGAVSVKVYNVAGELVRTLANDDRAAGSYTLVWDGRNDAGQPVSSGVYFYKLVTNSFSQTKKMVLLK
jgi:hypothetical protein